MELGIHGDGMWIRLHVQGRKVSRRRGLRSGGEQRSNNETVGPAGQGCKAISRRGERQGIGEGETTKETSRLEAGAYILCSGGRSSMREADHTDAVFRTGHAVAIGSELFGDRAVTDDDARDGGGVVRVYEHTAWRGGCGDQIRGDIVSEGRNKSSRKAEESTPSG